MPKGYLFNDRAKRLSEILLFLVFDLQRKINEMPVVLQQHRERDKGQSEGQRSQREVLQREPLGHDQRDGEL